MTQFYVPHTKRHPDVVAAAPTGSIWVDVSSGPDAYYHALRDWWAKGEDFAVIEHDVACRPDVVEAFDSCPEPWCVFPYDSICCLDAATDTSPCDEAWANMLGCTRFRAELMAAVPDALTSIPDEWAPKYGVHRRAWQNLCDELAGNKIGGVDQPALRPLSLRAAGFTHHWHRPRVHHISHDDDWRSLSPEQEAQ